MLKTDVAAEAGLKNADGVTIWFGLIPDGLAKESIRWLSRLEKYGGGLCPAVRKKG